LLHAANESPEGFLDLFSEKGEEEDDLLDGLSEYQKYQTRPW
jgi:hypothetical protein